MTNPQGEGAVLRVFFPIDNTLYSISIAFGMHPKMAELIEMPFGMMSRHCLRNSVLCGGDDPRRGRGSFWENLLDKPNTPTNCELDWSVQWRTHNRRRRLIARIGRVYYRPQRGWDCTLRAKSDIYYCLVVFDRSLGMT